LSTSIWRTAPICQICGFGWSFGRKYGKAVFAVEHGVRHQAVQAYAIGATDLVDRPVDRSILLATLFGDLGVLGSDPAALPIANSDGIRRGSEPSKDICLGRIQVMHLI